MLPTDVRLMARMVVAAVVTPLIVLAALAGVVAAGSPRLIILVAIALVVGTVRVVRDHKAVHAGREVSVDAAPELHATVERLCVLADLSKPGIVVEPDRRPNSWIVGTGRDRYRLHLTEGLIACLEPHELQAVIGHELAHVANRDAAVMTVVGGPSAAMLGGGMRLMRAGWWFMPGGVVAFAIGWLSGLGTRALSRYREFAADAGSVALTGSGAALASALVKVSDGLVSIPSRDLRAAAALDAFHLLPVARTDRDRLRLPATHPSLQARIERLQRLERALQSRR
jgi:heat shock protein HtpX